MTAHDPLCMSRSHPMGQFTVCDCGTIRMVRADEREKIAQALADLGYDYPAEVARRGGQP